MYTVREMLASVSVATRMSWAAHRQTIRDEDTAYCLLGLFDVNMPLLYGEGDEKAFLRLQREIVQQIPSDHSILAWGRGMSGSVRNKTSIFSPSPRWFAHIEDLSVRDSMTMTLGSSCIQLETLLGHLENLDIRLWLRK